MMSANRTHDEIDAEAAAWLARLQGPHRREETEAALKAWLSQSDAHEQAFERATTLWEMLPGAELERARSRASFRRPAKLAAAAAALVILVLGVGVVSRPVTYQTGVGQQQVLTLQDGTRVALNVDSEIDVLYDRHERRVRLDRGEAMFEVMKEAHRPFIVVSGDEQVRALGTTFVVRRDADKLLVTLIEGRIEVTRPKDDESVPAALLKPGERVTVTRTAGIALDRPAVEAVTAWRRGEVVFDGTALIEAAQELNRYGTTKLVVADPALSSLRVSGVFTTSDLADVADAIAKLHGLDVERRGNNLLLTRKHGS